MNRGNIPGFYWDSEKRKYFKIQDAHEVPSNAKYSRSSVTREKNQKRETKRRKVADEARMKDRIRPARILNQSPLLGSCGLLRELGTARPDRRDQAITEGLSSSEELAWTRASDGKILDYQQVGDVSVTARTSHLRTTVIRTAGRMVDENIGNKNDFRLKSSLVSMEAYDAGDRLMLFACTAGSELHSYYFFPIGERYLNPLSPSHVLQTKRINLTGYQHLWASRVNKEEMQYAAFTGVSRVSVHNLSRKQQIGVLDLEEEGESFALDWISPSTLAFGFTIEWPQETRHCVRLWDIRSSGSSGMVDRLPRSKRIIAVESDKSGHNIIVASNLAIDLYDLRVAKQDQAPLLSIAHRSSASRLDYALQPDNGLIAAVDPYGNIPVYSLRNGELVRTLKPAEQVQLERGDGLPRSLRWQEDDTGAPMLTSCAGNVVRAWTW